MESAPLRVVAMNWYLPEDFAEIKAIMEDPQNFHATYAEWLKAAEVGEKSHLAQGVSVYRAVIRPAEFRDWCRLHGKRLNSQGRNDFSAWLAAQVYANRA